MNIHPIFVHFPIALLTVYACAELVWSTRLEEQKWWWTTKAAFLVTGVLGGCAALFTGGLAEDVAGHSQLIEMHSTYAEISIIVFGVLLLAYIIKGCEMYLSGYIVRPHISSVFRVLSPLATFISLIAPGLALVGLITLTITGSLGGAIVYGSDVDPVVKFIYSLVIGS